ncbi:MAG: phenylalanine--tRNA ligase subunit beta [Oscillospiraceae bacterium]
MNLPLSWLNDYMDFSGIDNKTYTHKLTMTGSMVEGIDNPADNFKNVVVGKIIQIDAHPDADKLVVCQVDVGLDAPIQIVTGAKNVAVGSIVPVAKHKSVLPDGVKITKGKLRGVESFGMMCSTDELGITNGEATGIFLLPDDTKIGEDIAIALGMDESVAEFEITSNRPDCMSIIGLARETAATFDLDFNIPKIIVNENNENANDYASVEITDENLCSRFVGRVVKNVKIAPSPEWMQRRLKACGIRAINNVVDITNYILLEYGQPMHAYDLDNIEGKKIIVRHANKDEKLETLDDKPRTLNSEMIVISDEKRAIGVAGVMGGANSEVTDVTTTVLFESATFDPVLVRRGAKALGLRTDASALFEKGLDCENCMGAINRACELLGNMGGEVLGGTIDVYPKKKENTRLPFEPDKMNAFLGTEISKSEMIRLLKRLEFDIIDEEIIVPTFRGDVSCMADVAEEVVRMYGYDEIPVTMMKSEVVVGGKTPRQKLEDKSKNILTACGMYESITYSFIDPKEDKMVNAVPQDVVKITNPLGEENSVMRTTMLSSMMKTLRINFNRRNTDVSLFELGTVYLPTEQGKLPNEKLVMSMGMYGAFDFYDIKGAVEALIKGVGITNFSFEPQTENASYHPGRCAKVFVNGVEIGVIGQVHPKVSANFKIKTEVFAAELDFDAIIENATSDRHYAALPKFPATMRDIAVVVDKNVNVGDITKIFDAQKTKIVESYTLFDIYEGQQLGDNKKSVAYSISFRANDHTLTDEEVNPVMEKIVSDLKNELNAELR